jgi:hypothetical protein
MNWRVELMKAALLAAVEHMAEKTAPPADHPPTAI